MKNIYLPSIRVSPELKAAMDKRIKELIKQGIITNQTEYIRNLIIEDLRKSAE